jgi:hypothetical protein
VYFRFPRKDEEQRLLGEYHAVDTAGAGTPVEASSTT